jgi:hypothetical protein
MNREPWNWIREDLEQLVGQAESIRLEFKASRILDENKHSREQIAKSISSEVSAFANTEGGVIVIGINEKPNGKARIAEGIDEGVDIASWSPERLQGLIEGNISPYLTGIRIRSIPLDNNRTKVAYVIYIPQGTTAYQASDRKYYGRSEYEAKALPDHEIRLRMFRGKAPKATIIVSRALMREEAINKSNKNVWENLELDNPEEKDELEQKYIVRYFLKLSLLNAGEINISEYKARIQITPQNLAENSNSEFDVKYKDGDVFPSFGFEPSNHRMQINIYPEDTHEVAEITLWTPKGRVLSDYNPKIYWKLYLKDSYPTQGIINLSDVTAEPIR